MKNRGVLSKKEKLSITIKNLAKNCKSLDELSKKLAAHFIEPYYRKGILTGVWLGNRKFRLTTLGVGKEHLISLTIEQQRLDELCTIKNQKDKERGL